MKIRPKNILLFQNGGVPQWFLDRYGNRTKLLGWDLDQRYNYADDNLMTNDHRNAGNLDTVYRKNTAYTGTPGAVSSDIQAFYDSDGNGMSAEDFVKFYNKNAETIRSHWALDQTYNKATAGEHNRLFRKMFLSRSNMSQSPGSDYNIGYLLGLTKGGYDILDIEGSSTWLRRMDLYENEFDPNNPDNNRLHEITLKDGTKAIVYKKANGDIGLFNNTINGGELPEVTVRPNPLTSVDALHKDKYGFDWNKIKEGASKLFGNPDLYAFGRLAGNLINNERVYDELLKGIRPTLLSTYRTHRQVVGDEATKQAYYRRAAQGLTKAARPFTSDADRQMAYQYEAKRIGDELRALGDLADNQEIRRTSDESNQHQWDNTKRATEVANTNLASINQANALRHNLLAQKHSALWSSIDNFLKGIEYRKRQLLAENQAIDDNIFILEQQLDLLTDPTLRNAKQQLQKVIDKHTNKNTGEIDYNNDEVVNALLEYLKLKYKISIDLQLKRKLWLENRHLLNYAKSGVKVTYKKKEDLLYKSARDVVEHFRKMSKMSSDALDRKQPKILKLSSHPGSTKKYQQGGVAPFTVYTPVALGGEQSTTRSYDTSTTSSKASSKKEGNDTLDMIKELFKMVVGKGLPSDVNSLYTSMKNFLGRAQMFGTELDTDDIASMYLSLMLKLNQIEYLKNNFDKSKEKVSSNDGLNEVAVNYAGLLVGRTDDGEIKYANSLADAKEKGIRVLTNELLLQLRAIDPTLAGRHDLDGIAANGIGLSKIIQYIKSIKPNVGTKELTKEGYTKVLAGKIQAGFEMLQNAPVGDYEYSQYTKDLKEQILYALRYIVQSLPKNMLSVVKVHSELNGTTPSDLIESLLKSEENSESKLSFNAVTGKAAKDANGNSKEGGSDITPAIALSMGLGERETFVISDKTSDGLKISAVNLPLLDAQHHAMAAATLQQVGDGDYAGLLQLNNATMGGVKISPEGVNEVLVTGGRIHAAELPVDKQALQQGIVKPDLSFLKSIEKADLEIRDAGITDRSNLTSDLVKIINSIYTKNGLPMIYTLGSTGPELTSEYRRFAMVNATATLNAFEEDLSFNDGAIEASDDDRNRFESMMRLVTNNLKYSLDNGISIPFVGRLSGTDLYKGIVYIPMTESHISALSSTGYKASPEEYNLIDALDQQAEFIRSSGYKNPGSWTNK